MFLSIVIIVPRQFNMVSNWIGFIFECIVVCNKACDEDSKTKIVREGTEIASKATVNAYNLANEIK